LKEELELTNVEDAKSRNGTIEQQNILMNALIRHINDVRAENEDTITRVESLQPKNGTGKIKGRS
jgi:hypothetical protein